jgi:hypothetical protein
MAQLDELLRIVTMLKDQVSALEAQFDALSKSKFVKDVENVIDITGDVLLKLYNDVKKIKKMPLIGFKTLEQVAKNTGNDIEDVLKSRIRQITHS